MSKPPKLITWRGAQITITDFAAALGISRGTVATRLRHGMSPERIATTPPDPAKARARHSRREVGPDEDRTAALAYTCPRCGGTFAIPTMVDVDIRPRGKKTELEARPYVRLGGQQVCEVCATRRYPRRPNSDRWIGDCTIPLTLAEDRHG